MSGPTVDIAPVEASSPGKVLLVGGYLVLEEQCGGASVAVTSRFHTEISLSEAHGPEFARGELPVVIRSPQFHCEWAYNMHITPVAGCGGAGEAAEPTVGSAVAVHAGAGKGNVYVGYAVNTALLAIVSHPQANKHLAAVFRAAQESRRSVCMRLRADNDFYSQRAHLTARGLPVSLSSLASLPPYLPFPLRSDGEPEVHKTGLGSSAALVTSTVGAVLAFFGGLHTAMDDHQFKSVVHDIAQIAHGLAQGKIGSGFDVCSAAFGSVLYHRIPPTVLGKHMEDVDRAIQELTRKERSDFYFHWEGARLTLSDWAYTAKPFGLPRGLGLMLADVAGGSETPGMVRSVLAWKNSAPASTESAAELALAVFEDTKYSDAQYCAVTKAADASAGPRLWRLLAACNARVAVLLDELHHLASSAEDYDERILQCSKLTTASLSAARDESPVHATLFATSFALKKCRNALREVGVLAGVPIEPPEQTQLADATCQVPGVLAAGVPGAGGYDALFVVHLAPAGDDVVRSGIETAWVRWPGGGLTPLLLTNGARLGDPGSGLLVGKPSE